MRNTRIIFVILFLIMMGFTVHLFTRTGPGTEVRSVVKDESEIAGLSEYMPPPELLRDYNLAYFKELFMMKEEKSVRWAYTVEGVRKVYRNRFIRISVFCFDSFENTVRFFEKYRKTGLPPTVPSPPGSVIGDVSWLWKDGQQGALFIKGSTGVIVSGTCFGRVEPDFPENMDTIIRSLLLKIKNDK